MPINFTDGTFYGTDANGAPLSGGLLYTYRAGSLVPKSTWTTFAKTQANTNPVVLDETGRARVWIDGTESYRFILRTEDEVTVWDVDNISPITASNVAADLMDLTSPTKNAGMVSFDEGLDYLEGSVGYSLKQALAVTETEIDPHLAPWNADNTGATDVTDIFNACFTFARATGSTVRPTPGVYKFDGSLNPQGIELVGPGVYLRETEEYLERSVIFLHNGDVPLFVPQDTATGPTGAGWVCRGITFYDPNQPGTGTVPVERPALIEPLAPARMVDVTFEANIVINSYIFLKVPEGSLMGDTRILNNRIYAIKFLFEIVADVPDVLFVSGNMFSPGVYQSRAVFFNGAMLSSWSGGNAIAFAVNPGDGNSIDGFKSCNNIYFSFRTVFQVDSGSIDVSTSTGDNFDAVNSLILTQGTGGINGFTITGGSFYSYRVASPSTRTRGFDFTSSSLCNVTVDGLRLEVCAGDWLVDSATAPTIFNCNSYVGQFATATGLTGDAYAFRIDNAQAEYNLRPMKIRCDYADAIGVSVKECAEVLISGVPFNSVRLPIALEDTIDAGARVLIVGNMSRNTSGTKSLEVGATVLSNGSATAHSNRWDKTTDLPDT